MLLGCGLLTRCGFVDDPLNYPITGSFGGTIQLDALALRAEPIPSDCSDVCLPMRDCELEVDYGAGGAACSVKVKETLRVDVSLAAALPELANVENTIEVREVGPVSYTYAMNTLSNLDLQDPVVVWLAPKNDADPSARIKLATLPPPPRVTPASASVTVTPEVAMAFQDLIARGDNQFTVVVTTKVGPLLAGQVPPTGSVILNLDVAVSLAGKPLH